MSPEEVEHPHCDQYAKLELEAINELLCDGFAGRAAVILGQFLDHVHVIPVQHPSKEKD